MLCPAGCTAFCMMHAFPSREFSCSSISCMGFICFCNCCCCVALKTTGLGIQILTRTLLLRYHQLREQLFGKEEGGTFKHFLECCCRDIITWGSSYLCRCFFLQLTAANGQSSHNESSISRFAADGSPRQQ